LIEAMQHAWRFVDDEVLRDRLKEAKGIGTPATRAEIIGGLKRQNFLTIQAKNIVPTATGLTLYGVLQQADPALVDPGVTAQLECLLDDVVFGKQEMVGAIDAVCDVAQRIIGKFKQGTPGGSPPLLAAASGGGTGGGRPPTPAMKRFADSIMRQKRIKPPAGYATSGSICRAFLEQHAPRKFDCETAGKNGLTTPSPAQMLFAAKIAQEKGVVISDEARASSAAMSAWIQSNQAAKLGKGQRTSGERRSKSTPAKRFARMSGDEDSNAPKKRTRRLRTGAPAAEAPTTTSRQNTASAPRSGSETTGGPI
jgi:DNA topoisomerase-3